MAALKQKHCEPIYRGEHEPDDSDYWYQKDKEARQELADQSRPFPSFMLEDGTVLETEKE